MAASLVNLEHAVLERYSEASKTAEAALCCAVEYDPRYLDVLPAEIIERDYGCGDPSRHVREGETVLDLGSGGGKICYIASQIVGPRGRVIGVDMNDDMLALARRYQAEIGRRIGWHNVEFHKGRIQDLGLDLDRFDARLRDSPVASSAEWTAALRLADEMRQQTPLVPSETVDVVLSNCVLNLVSPHDRELLFREVFRVLRAGGRAVISDIVSDRAVPDHLRHDPRLWSGCISGAFVECEFLEKFTGAGFHGVEIVSWQDRPWTTVEGIEFRSITVRAFKPPTAQVRELAQSVIYRGPWASAMDEEGNVLRRGERTTVSDAQFARYTREPYAADILAMGDELSLAALSSDCCSTGKCC